MTYKNVGKPTFLFCIYRCIVTLPFGDEHYINNNLKGELAVMDSLGIKPNYAALGRKYGMDWRTVKKYHNGYEESLINEMSEAEYIKINIEGCRALKTKYIK